jgi:Fe/S biogenesis protein NfuA
VLKSEVNPAVEGHGGLVTLIDVRKNVVFIKMGGDCQGCGMAAVTLKYVVETAIRQAVPEVGAIYDTTDHAAGRNIYYVAP